MSIYTSGSADNAVAVVPSDVTILSPTLYLIIGGAGNLTVTMVGGMDAVIPVLASQVLPLRVTKVKAATTATGIVAFW